MPGNLKLLQPFNNVAASQTAVLPVITQGMTFERILLELGGTSFTKALITGIRVILGGKKIWEISGSDLDAINQYHRLTANASFLSLWFADPTAKNKDDYLAGALDTSLNYSSFSMEVDIGAATAPTLVAYADQSAPLPRDAQHKGLFRTMVKSVHAPAAANEFALPIPFGSKAGAIVRGVHLFHANITKLQVVKDSFYLMEQGYNAVNQFIEGERYNTAQSGLLSWDPMYGGYDSDAIPTLRQDGNPATFEFKVTTSAADNIRAYSDLFQNYMGF